jgi:hypothetical protein
LTSASSEHFCSKPGYGKTCKTCSTAPFLKLIWARWQSGQDSNPKASVFCIIAARVLHVSLTSGKRGKSERSPVYQNRSSLPAPNTTDHRAKWNHMAEIWKTKWRLNIWFGMESFGLKSVRHIFVISVMVFGLEKPHVFSPDHHVAEYFGDKGAASACLAQDAARCDVHHEATTLPFHQVLGTYCSNAYLFLFLSSGVPEPDL